MQSRQVFQDFISSGLKYVRQIEGPPIRIYSVCGNGHCRYFVEDNGGGFHEKYVDQIFKPFRRPHGRDHYRGTGIGCEICKQIVERHGGSIIDRSKPGKRSTFIVSLPSKPTATWDTHRQECIPRMDTDKD